MIQIYVLKKFKLGSYKQDIKLSSYRKDKLHQARNFEFIDEQYLSEVFLAYVLHQNGIQGRVHMICLKAKMEGLI